MPPHRVVAARIHLFLKELTQLIRSCVYRAIFELCVAIIMKRFKISQKKGTKE